MKPVIYFLIILLLFDLVGYFVVRKVSQIVEQEERDFLRVTLAVGAAVIVCASQLLCIFFNAHFIALLWWGVVLIICVYYGKCYIQSLIDRLTDNKILLWAVVGCFVLFSYPMILRNDALSYQYMNNDIIYYLSTIDWMKDHNVLQEVQYTVTQPLYVCAEYIFSTTRFGLDILASTLSCMLGLEAHEIFSLLGIVFIIICSSVLYYMAWKVLHMTKKQSTVVFLLIALSYNWKELLVLQYVPQILGVCFLMAFITFLIEYYNTYNTFAAFLSALFLSATASVYAEYASYMFIIYIGFLVIQCVFTKTIWENVKKAVGIGVLGVLCNPFGFLIAVKFNLRILHSVSTSPSNIDAYGGNMKTISEMFAQLLGFFGGSRIENVFIQRGSTIFIFVLVILVTILFLRSLWKKRIKTLFFIGWVLAFFVSYESYFRLTHLAYGEFKHIIGIGFFVTVIILYSVGDITRLQKLKAGTLLALVILAINLISFAQKYPFDEVVLYDATLMEVREGLKEVPEGATIGVLGNAHYIQHELVYAAKDRNVNLMGSGINSYFTMLGVTLNNEKPNYILCERNSPELADAVTGMYAIVWENSRFMIIILGE